MNNVKSELSVIWITRKRVWRSESFLPDFDGHEILICFNYENSFGCFYRSHRIPENWVRKSSKPLNYHFCRSFSSRSRLADLEGTEEKCFLATNAEAQTQKINCITSKVHLHNARRPENIVDGRSTAKRCWGGQAICNRLEVHTNFPIDKANESKSITRPENYLSCQKPSAWATKWHLISIKEQNFVTFHPINLVLFCTKPAYRPYSARKTFHILVSDANKIYCIDDMFIHFSSLKLNFFDENGSSVRGKLCKSVTQKSDKKFFFHTK